MPFRSAADPLTLPVRRLTFSGPAVHRVIGLVQAPDNAKAALSDTLFAELRSLWPVAEKPARKGAAAVRANGTRGRNLLKKNRK